MGGEKADISTGKESSALGWGGGSALRGQCCQQWIVNYKHVYFIICSGKQYFQPQQTEQSKRTATSVPLPRDVRYVGSGVSFQAQAGLVQACVSSTHVSFDTLRPRDCPWTTGPREHVEMCRVRGPVGFSLVLGNSPPCCSEQKPQ